MAPPQVNIRKQPRTQPCYFALGSGSQSQPVAPHFSLTTIPLSHPNPSPPCPCQNPCPCHKLPPSPPSAQNGEQRTSSESSNSDESLPPHP